MTCCEGMSFDMLNVSMSLLWVKKKIKCIFLFLFWMKFFTSLMKLRDMHFFFLQKRFQCKFTICIPLNHAFGHFWYHHGDLVLQNVRYSKRPQKVDILFFAQLLVYSLNIFPVPFLIFFFKTFAPTGWWFFTGKWYAFFLVVNYWRVFFFFFLLFFFFVVF